MSMTQIKNLYKCPSYIQRKMEIISRQVPMVNSAAPSLAMRMSLRRKLPQEPCPIEAIKTPSKKKYHQKFNLVQKYELRILFNSMATVTLRSSRGSKGLTTRSSARNNASALGNRTRYQQPSNVGRKKHLRDSLDEEKELISAKRAKIAIEIEPYPTARQPKTRSVLIQDGNRNDVLVKRSAAPAPAVASAAAVKSVATRQTPTEPPPAKSIDHHQKVVNGIKHELDRLQDRLAPPKPDKDEKRKLRSQEGTRFKSELSLYFPEYDEVIGNDPKEDRESAICRIL